jgi:hypothetical protein
MKVTAWRGATFGIRFGPNARAQIKRDWRSIGVKIDGTVHLFKLTSTFWTTCPEIRGNAIGHFLLSRDLAPWRKGHPPVLELITIGDALFELEEEE